MQFEYAEKDALQNPKLNSNWNAVQKCCPKAIDSDQIEAFHQGQASQRNL